MIRMAHYTRFLFLLKHFATILAGEMRLEEKSLSLLDDLIARNSDLKETYARLPQNELTWDVSCATFS